MKIKIEIVGVFPKDGKKATPLQINKFEELALFLDCATIQTIINNFRRRIGMQKPISYEKFSEWKERGITQDKLSRKEKTFLYNLDVDIDYLSNKPGKLDKKQRSELNRKEKERLKWLDPFYTFSKALGEKLKFLKSDKFQQVLIKAVVCGEVRNKDFPNELVKRKGARSAIFIGRELYWLYKTIHPEKGIKMGYGLAGKQLSISLQTARSSINSYKNKLKKYISDLKTS